MNGTPETIRYTADVVVITGDRRVLLIERAKKPYEGQWALPGGHVDAGETSRQAAARELFEETGIEAAADDLWQVGIWDTPGRDPRGRYVTVAYVMHIEYMVNVTAGDDARRARWWPMYDLPIMAFDHVDIIRHAADTVNT